MTAPATVHLAPPDGDAACGVTLADLVALNDPDSASTDMGEVTCPACKLVGQETTAAADDSLALMRLNRRVGIAYLKSVNAGDAYKSIQADAQVTYREIRRRGTPQQEISLPDGTKAALVSIEQGGTTVTVDEDMLQAVAAGNNPRDFEDYVEVIAFSDPRVIRLIAEHYPALVGRRIRPAARADYLKEIGENAGRVIDRVTGERVQVAEVTRHEPTGKYSVRWTAKGRIALQEALDAGTLNDRGEAEGDEAEVPGGGA